MGILTTITIYNDSADQIKQHPQEFTDKVSKALSGEQLRIG